MTTKSVSDIADAIRSSDNKPALIAIEGFGGAGKSTVAEKLKTALGNAYVIGIDEFIVKENILKPSWDNGGFDRSRLEKEVLVPFNSGVPIKYQSLDWESNSLSEPTQVPKVDYLIIEGISTYHPEIEKYYDFKIWVDLPMDEAKRRGHLRDGSNENAANWDLWHQNDLDYLAKYHPDKRADFVFDNS